MSGFEEVPAVVGEGLYAGFGGTEVLFEAGGEVAVLEAEVAGVEAALAAEEAALAAAAAEEGVLLATEAGEAAAGPFGWIPMLITAGIALSVIAAMAVMRSNIQTMQEQLGEKKKKIEVLKQAPISSPSKPAKAPASPDIVAPGIHDVLGRFPDGPVVNTFDLFSCEYDYYYSRCRRKRRFV